MILSLQLLKIYTFLLYHTIIKLRMQSFNKSHFLLKVLLDLLFCGIGIHRPHCSLFNEFACLPHPYVVIQIFIRFILHKIPLASLIHLKDVKFIVLRLVNKAAQHLNKMSAKFPNHLYVFVLRPGLFRVGLYRPFNIQACEIQKTNGVPGWHR